MNPRDAHSIDFFSKWLAKRIAVVDNTVAGVIEALNRHSMADDQTAQDYVMPIRRCREYAGRFRIYRENQDTFYRFVNAGDESKIDPPVYFESCIDLYLDYGIAESDIINNDHVLVAKRFTDFLWRILGHHICLRLESGGQFAGSVNGIVIDGGVELDDSFINPLGNEFPVGYTCLVSDDVVCIPGWGAAFLTVDARDSFLHNYRPKVARKWQNQAVNGSRR